MSPRNKDKRRNLLRKPLGAMLGGISEALLFHPLDTIKTKIQLSNKPLSFSQCVKEIGSVNNFYRGLTPVVMNLSLKYVFRFQMNFGLRRLMENDCARTTTLQNFSAGLITGVSEALLIVTPFDVVKTKLQSNPVKYPNFTNSLKTIIGEEGICGLWRGCLPTVIRQGSNQACMFTSYTLLRNNFFDPFKPIDPVSAFAMGLVSSSVGPLCNAPIDTIKTRMMIQSKNNEKYKNSIFQTVKQITKEEGVFALYRGLFPRLLRLCPGQATVWLVVEQFNKSCDSYEVLM